MRNDHFRMEQLSEGIFEITPAGSIRKIRDLKLLHELKGPSLVGLDPVLIDTGKACILLDAGLGIGLDSLETDHETSNILTNLEIFGYKPEDITDVILTHLHYDHVAGLSFTGTDNQVTATLPNARIHVQKAEWEAALDSIQNHQATQGIGYEPDDLYRLAAEDRFVFLEKENQEILPGITIIRTGGHSAGHQVVRIRQGPQTSYFCGDLIPSEHFLQPFAIGKSDIEPIKARKARTLLIQQACREKATLLFYHSVYNKTGTVVRDKHHRFIFKK